MWFFSGSMDYGLTRTVKHTMTKCRTYRANKSDRASPRGLVYRVAIFRNFAYAQCIYAWIKSHRKSCHSRDPWCLVVLTPQNVTKRSSVMVGHPRFNQTRSSATAEKQRVSCPHGGARPSSPHPPPPLATSMHMVESETRNKRTSSVPSTKRTLRWIGHSRSFKVTLICTGRNPERCVVVMCN